MTSLECKCCQVTSRFILDDVIHSNITVFLTYVMDCHFVSISIGTLINCDVDNRDHGATKLIFSHFKRLFSANSPYLKSKCCDDFVIILLFSVVNGVSRIHCLHTMSIVVRVFFHMTSSISSRTWFENNSQQPLREGRNSKILIIAT